MTFPSPIHPRRRHRPPHGPGRARAWTWALAALLALHGTGQAQSAGPGAAPSAAPGAAPSTGPSAAQALHLRALAATCANCHGTDGHAIEGSLVPGLAGVPASLLADQLRGFRQGSLPATVMHQLAKGYTDAQIDALARYFAAVPRRPR